MDHEFGTWILEKEQFHEIISEKEGKEKAESKLINQ